jgi:hypothetical protein
MFHSTPSSAHLSFQIPPTFLTFIGCPVSADQSEYSLTLSLSLVSSIRGRTQQTQGNNNKILISSLIYISRMGGNWFFEIETREFISIRKEGENKIVFFFCFVFSFTYLFDEIMQLIFYEWSFLFKKCLLWIFVVVDFLYFLFLTV